MYLYGTGSVDQDAVDTGRRRGSHGAGEITEIDTGAGHGDDALTQTHLDIYPDIGLTQARIRVDIELHALRAVDRGIEPGVLRHAGTHHLDDLATRIAVGAVVVIVVAGCPRDEEVAAIAEMPTITGQFGERLALQGRVVFAHRPALQQRRIRQLARQCDLGEQRPEDVLTVVLRLTLGETTAEGVDDAVGGEGEEKQRQAADQQKNHHQSSDETPAQRTRGSAAAGAAAHR